MSLSLNEDCYLITKTKNEFDDVNFDDKSEYKNECYKLIQSCGIKYVIDFHGLSHDRGIDINFGTHIGKNIENDRKLFEEFKGSLKKTLLFQLIILSWEEFEQFLEVAKSVFRIYGPCKLKLIGI